MERSDAENEMLPGTGHDALVAIERGSERDAAENPWVRMAGIFADEPLIWSLLAEVYAARDAEREAEDLAE